MKDPAFLFYPADWTLGTMHMTLLEKGAYIELLMLQFSRGKFTLAHAKHMLSSSFDLAWATVSEKFVNDGEYYWNERLEFEKDKRKKFTESRRNNAMVEKKPKKQLKKDNKHMLEHMPKHMGNVNINENIDKDISITSIIELFNNITGKKITLIDSRKKMINARLEEKHTITDFEKVIRTKNEEWKNDPQMSKYITPETLFAPSKFTKYLEQSETFLTQERKHATPSFVNDPEQWLRK